MVLENLKKFVDFARDFITDLPCGLDVLPEEWVCDEDGENLVVNAAFAELKEAREKLSRYEQAEEEGRLVALPCKVGTHLFLVRNETNIICECEMVGFGIREFGQTMRLYIFDDDRFTTTPVENYGKTVFLIPEEATAALKERENDG